LLRRRHICIDQVKYIGKESNHLEAVDAGLIHSENNIYTEHWKRHSLQNMCNVCGNEIQNVSEQCRFCAVENSTQRLTVAASKGRPVSHTSTAEAKRSKTRKANHAALREWSASDQPAWLTEEFYAEKIQPLLAPLSSRAIARQLRVSRGYANEIRNGRVPHPRHWQTLARPK
jgi:hypothetical protein